MMRLSKSGLMGAKLRERLLFQAGHWPRAKGAMGIRDSVHPDCRSEGTPFQEAAFEAANPAEVWRKAIR